MRCMRIFPELCARTVYPFSNSTRNMAFGRGSTTVPSTVNASSFGLLRFFLLVTARRDVKEQKPLHGWTSRHAKRSADNSTKILAKRKSEPDFAPTKRIDASIIVANNVTRDPSASTENGPMLGTWCQPVNHSRANPSLETSVYDCCAKPTWHGCCSRWVPSRPPFRPVSN